jgi:hypothetical protein
MNKYQLWETVFYQKGKEYLQQKIDHFQQLIDDEEKDKEFELGLPGSEFRDFSFYEIQIEDYHETVEVIKSVIHNCSSRKLFIHKPKAIVSDDTEKKEKAINPIELPKQTINKPPVIKKEIKRVIPQNLNPRINNKKIYVNYIRIIWLSSLIFFFIFLIFSYFIFGSNPILKYSAFFSYLIIFFFVGILFFVYFDLTNLKRHKLKLKSQYYNLLANKLGCIVGVSSISGIYKGRKIKLSTYPRQDRFITKLSIACYKKNLPSFWISTSEKKNTGLKRVFSDNFLFDSKFKIYSNNHGFIKSFVSEDITNSLVNFISINKNFEFSLFDNTIYYLDHHRKMSSMQDVDYFEKIINLFLNVAKALEGIR